MGVKAEASKFPVFFFREFIVESTPAFAFESYPFSVGFKEELYFLRRKFGVTDVKHHFEIEPILIAVFDFKLHLTDDGRVFECGEFAFESYLDVGGDRLEPAAELFGKRAIDREDKFGGVWVGRGFYAVKECLGNCQAGVVINRDLGRARWGVGLGITVVGPFVSVPTRGHLLVRSDRLNRDVAFLS